MSVPVGDGGPEGVSDAAAGMVSVSVTVTVNDGVTVVVSVEV